jgi:hypothetical protein
MPASGWSGYISEHSQPTMTRSYVRATGLAVLLFLCIGTNAQVLVGPKAGVNLATQHASEGEQPSSTLLGFMGGIQMKIRLAPALLFEPELIYIQKGFRDVEEGAYYEADQRFYFNYMEVPALIKFAIGNEDRVRALIAVGPYAGFLMNVKMHVKATVLGDTDEFTDVIDLDEYDISRIDAGLCGGAGVSVPTSFGEIRLEARYQLGLVDLDTSDDEYSVTNKGAQIGLAFLFNAGRKASSTPPPPAP